MTGGRLESDADADWSDAADAAVSSSVVMGDETKREVCVRLLLLELVEVDRNDNDDEGGAAACLLTKAPAWAWKADSAPELSARATTT